MNKEDILKLTKKELLETFNKLSCNDCNYCNGCYNCYHCNGCYFCYKCIDCYYCDYCYYCKGLKNEKYHILNVKFTKDEYFEFINNLKD